MDELKWAKLTEVYGRMDADLIESYLKANGIEVELFQEAVGHRSTHHPGRPRQGANFCPKRKSG